MSAISDLVRHRIRRLVYSPPFEHFVDAVRTGVETSGAQYWDSCLTGPFRAYVEPTISTITHANIIATLARLHLPEATSALDMGCGGGHLGESLAGERFTEYCGVDVSRFAVEAAKKRLCEQRETFPVECRFEVGALEKYKPGKTFDLIVFSQVLYYLPTSEMARIEALRCASWLNDGGLVCVALKDDGKSLAISRRLATSFHFVSSMLFQEQVGVPGYAIRANRERPGYLISLLSPK